MAIQVVAFDVHGTLAHWSADRVQPVDVQRLLSRFGVEISYWAFDAARQTVLLLDAPKRKIDGWTDFLALTFARMQTPVSIDLLTSLTAMFERRDDMEPYPDGLEALRAIKARGLKTCAFTTLPEFMLGRAGPRLLPLIDRYFNCSGIGVAKGDRRFYARITERLAVPPDCILCAGDDPVGDVELPTEAGWNAVLLDRTGECAELRVGQRATIALLNELPDIIDRLAEDGRLPKT